MALTQAVHEALEAELKHLEIQRQRIDKKITHLKAILAPEEDLFQAPLPLSGMDKPMPQERSEAGQLVGKGLADAIRSLLATYPTGLRSAEVIEKLQRNGYKPTNPSRLKPAVNSELWRMTHNNRLSKRGKRYFLPVTEEKREAQAS
jgi:hypothetical protein